MPYVIHLYHHAPRTTILQFVYPSLALCSLSYVFTRCEIKKVEFTNPSRPHFQSYRCLQGEDLYSVQPTKAFRGRISSMTHNGGTGWYVHLREVLPSIPFKRRGEESRFC